MAPFDVEDPAGIVADLNFGSEWEGAPGFQFIDGEGSTVSLSLDDCTIEIRKLHAFSVSDNPGARVEVEMEAWHDLHL